MSRISRFLSVLPLAALAVPLSAVAATLPAATPPPAANATSAAPGMALDITLRSGFEIQCDHIQQIGERARLFLHAGAPDYLDVIAADIASSQSVPLPPPPPVEAAAVKPHALSASAAPAPVDLHKLTSQAGAHNDLDAELIAAIVRQESAGNPYAVSRAGAKGLMQLMPGTANKLGVSNSFDPAQNVEGGTAYFNSLLLRYHDNLPLALAAYNAGPGAVDKYHGVPPYRETRAYVARIIHDFNRRKAELAREQKVAAAHAAQSLAAGVLR